MKMATVLLSPEPVFIIRRHRGMTSVVRRKLMTSDESFFIRALITLTEVRRKYSNWRDCEVVLRNGKRKRGMCAAKVR
jgi:hypothetical protein